MKKNLVFVLMLALVGSSFVFAADEKAAATTAPAATTTTATVAPATDQSATGVVVSVKAANKAKKIPETLTIKADSKDVAFVLSASTKVIGADGKDAKVSALKAKVNVTVAYSVKDGVKEATSVTIAK
jgi:hypothetical protein